MGSGGYTVVISGSNYVITCHHVSPNFIVSVNDTIEQGQIIAQVGPKNVYNFFNNPYRDEYGNPTNGATTGPHLHLSIKKDNELINPLSLFPSIL